MRFQRAAVLVFAVAMSTHAMAQAEKPEEGSSLDQRVSYEGDIRPIVKNFCTTCHAGKNPEGDFVLTSYESVREHVEKGTLLKRINDAGDPMPQDGLMPRPMRRLFRRWADQGFVRNGPSRPSNARKSMQTFVPQPIEPVDINQQGFELLEKLQGHWVGSMNLMGQPFEWWAFDFRATAPSHVHGIFEGGSIGNLFTSFFVTEFGGKRTIMARNGGILNGIYRVSYFVLDDVQQRRNGTYYRLVDVHGGQEIMSMELTFRGDSIEFKAFTSRFGLTEPKQHMLFQGRRRHQELAAQAAKDVGFPKNIIDFEFPQSLPKPTWTEDYPQTSATYLWEDASKGPLELGKLSRDPRRIDQVPHLAKLKLKIPQNAGIRAKKLQVYLSRDALVDERGKFLTRYGYIREELLDTLLQFPELAASTEAFEFTYLHPGAYYVTVVVDMDGDRLPSPGDRTHRRMRVVVPSNATTTAEVPPLTVQN